MKGDISKYTLVLSMKTLTFDALNPKPETITVTVNGSSNSKCYDIVTDMDWITVKRNSSNGNLGEVTIVPSTNNITNYTKEGYIIFYHKADHEVFQVLDITQENINFEVIPEIIELTFPAETENSQVIKVTVKGGRKGFYINAINEYDADENIRLSYDNAFEFSVTPLDDDTGNQESKTYNLAISSHGIITTGVRYEVILTHSDLRNIYAVLSIQYGEIDLTLPKIESEEFVYCTDLENMEITANTLSVQTMAARSIDVVKPIIEENISMETNGAMNPDIIDLNGNEVRIKVYTVIDNNGVKETDSDIYVKLSSSIATVRYAKEEYTMDYKVIYVSKSDSAKFNGIRYCGMTVYNKERRKQYIKTVLKVKG